MPEAFHFFPIGFVGIHFFLGGDAAGKARKQGQQQDMSDHVNSLESKVRHRGSAFPIDEGKEEIAQRTASEDTCQQKSGPQKGAAIFI
jgi:hypothetical protein